jgi:transposase
LERLRLILGDPGRGQTPAESEEPNNLIKRIKRIGFGFRNFKNYRIRALLYAGKPNWRVLGSIVVR